MNATTAMTTTTAMPMMTMMTHLVTPVLKKLRVEGWEVYLVRAL